jgi:endonuclease/exonuclease/phosphatase (EEP) superfamily protein YafD
MPKIKRLLRQYAPSQRFLKATGVIHQYHSSPVDLSPHTIKVLNWNIAKNNESSAWIEEFTTLLRQHDPDLICLQEVRLSAETRQIAELADRSWNFAPNFIDAHHNAYAGILTAARAHHQTGESLLTTHYEPVTHTPKVSLFTEYILAQSEPLLTINAHLINFVEPSQFQAQLQAIETRIATHSGAVIFAGDCNTWSLWRWMLLQKMASRLHLKQAAFSFQDDLKIKRFLFSPPLDYIFYRGLHQSHALVLNCSSSDHNPMIVQFSRQVGSHPYGY